MLTAGWGGVRLAAGARAEAANAAPSIRDPAADEARDRYIAFFEGRVQSDPYSAEDLGLLSSLFLQRARETGDHEDVVRAEATARRSLALRTAHNARASAVLAASLLEQHRFGEALDVARRLVQSNPESAAFRAMLGEIQLELGQYAAADTTFGSLESSRAHLDVAPRLARWAELSGKTTQARQLLYAARDRALLHYGLAPEQRAWFHLRVGDLEFRHGELDRAEKSLRAGLAVFPADYRLLSAMARLEGARGRWKEAIEHAEQVLAILPDPATLALTSELYAASGDSARAREYAGAVEVSLSAAEGSFHRADGLFLLDHGRRVPEVLAQAEKDLRSRRDIYGYDLLAWALHKQGRHAEAAVAMRGALRTGSRDPLLLYHAGMIERALGHSERAREYLEDALDANPHFSLTQAPLARAALDSVRGGWLPRWLRAG